MSQLAFDFAAIAPPVERHQRGQVRLPYPVYGRAAGELVAAWACCDPMCGGVELSQYVLEINHGCCDIDPGRHSVGFGRRNFTGAYHGPFTEHWIAP